MQSAGINTMLTVQTHWDHVSLTVPSVFFFPLQTEVYTKHQQLVKRLYLLQSVSIKTEEYITLTRSKYIICSLMFFLFKKNCYKVLCLNRDIEKISVFTVPSYLQQKLQRQHTQYQTFHKHILKVITFEKIFYLSSTFLQYILRFLSSCFVCLVFK